jgi:UDP-glucose 4-epimerase
MKVLVTGGAGFIGSHVADALVASGHEVVILDDLSTGREANLPAGATFERGDLRDDGFLDGLFERHAIDVVTHQAAQTSVSVSTREPVRDADVNILGSLKLLDRCIRHGVKRFVFASTGGAIYGEVPDGTLAQLNWTPRPISPYACSKLAFETYLNAHAATHALEAHILRYANVYGPRQDPHGEAGVVAIFCQRLRDGQPIRVNARQEPGDDGCVRDYVYVGDVVRTNLQAIAGERPPGTVHVGTGVETTTRQLADALVERSGRASPLEFGPRRAGDVERSVLEPDDHPQRGELTPLEAGLAETFAYFAGR